MRTKTKIGIIAFMILIGVGMFLLFAVINSLIVATLVSVVSIFIAFGLLIWGAMMDGKSNGV